MICFVFQSLINSMISTLWYINIYKDGATPLKRRKYWK
jgi:hypothetical protein